MGNDVNNVSARLSDTEYTKLKELKDYMQANSYSKVSLADAMRVSIIHMHDTVIVKNITKEKVNNPVEIVKEESNTDNDRVEAPQTNRNEGKTVNPITEQVNAFKESLKGQIDPDTDKPYTQTKINKLGTAKRKELQETE